MKPSDMRIVIPEGCEVERIDTQDGALVVTFKNKEPQLPKTWEEFCEMYPIKGRECHIDNSSGILNFRNIGLNRDSTFSRNVLPDRATAEAVLALCQLIQLRDFYNQGWQPDWNDDEPKYSIDFYENEFDEDFWCCLATSPLYFKSGELRDEFLRNFRPLIEKLKPLYGIKEGGEE